MLTYKLLAFVSWILCSKAATTLDVSGVPQFLSDYNTKYGQVKYEAALAEWNYNTNITKETQKIAGEKSQAQAVFKAEQAEIASQVPLDQITDPTNRRLMKKIAVRGTGALSSQDLSNLTNVNARMQTAYSTAKVCNLQGHHGCLPLDPDLTAIMANDKNYNTLRDAWMKWRDVSGKTLREDYKQYVELENKAAVLNGFSDNGARWRDAYESPDFEQLVEEQWQTILPLYEQLHAYVRRKLYNRFGGNVINLKGPIPAHLFGNMWAQSWGNIYDIAEPFSGKERPDATVGLQEKGYNATDMFRTADKFFTDLGLEPLPQEFWDESMIVKPKDGREVVCHASAWDFYNQKDFRIKMCTVINQEDFITIHHEMGHIQYYLQYKNLPVVFRRGGNNGFHEAVGDTLALSVSTLGHLYGLGLIEKPVDDMESDINYLMSMALEKIAFLPFGYLMDRYRWKVFSGEISENDLNKGWWADRTKYQGVVPPVPRSEKDFDPGAKFHISNDVPYVRYFISYILQFQFYEAMCKEAGHTGDLFKCDFDGSKAAGAKLANMLKLGSSEHWEDALEQITGSRKMSSASLVRYFKPLLEYLEEENRKNDEVIGWPDTEWTPPIDTFVREDGYVETVGHVDRVLDERFEPLIPMTLSSAVFMNSPIIKSLPLLLMEASKRLEEMKEKDPSNTKK